MKPIICFIDDSAFEHDLVRNEIAPLAPDLQFIQAYTFDQAQQILGENGPSLFLLDLWGQDPDVQEPYLMPLSAVAERVDKFPTLHDVYEGLDRFEGDMNNEFLKRFFSIVASWRILFEQVCAKIGQNRKYGLYNLGRVRECYPGIPAVFYTRKSLISDAVAIFRVGTDGLFIKPTGASETETRRLTRNFAPRLATELKQIIWP